MKAHAALPDRKHLQRMAQVVGRLVKQAVADATAHHHTHDAEEQDVFNVAWGPWLGLADGRKGFVLQARSTEQHKERKRREVGQPVPVNGQGAELQRDGIDLGMNQHVSDCAR
ncbi:hypothetical protein D9M70_581990 [compost metagenome]